VLINPPRAGARETVSVLPALAPSRIVVVSCDPATLARDAAALAAGGYSLAAVRPIDLFPQTAHVETVALFNRAVRGGTRTGCFRHGCEGACRKLHPPPGVSTVPNGGR
jgi:hypothetical protein